MTGIHPRAHESAGNERLLVPHVRTGRIVLDPARGTIERAAYGTGRGIVVLAQRRTALYCLRRRDRGVVNWILSAPNGASVVGARLMYACFVRPIDPGERIIHRDGDPANLRPENLQAVTRREHLMRMQRRAVLATRGECAPKAVLNESMVREIRSQFASRGRGSLRAIARELRLGYATVYAAATGITWSHVA